MRSLATPLILALVGCAVSTTDTTQAPAVRAVCDQRTACFNQRAVRDFRVLDTSSMVVFVGAAGCPYLVDVEGFFCNLRAASYLAFQDLDGRICSLDRSYIVSNPFAGEDEYCQVRSVEPLNDDELVETFAAYGIVEPLPATGSGELEVIETSEDGAAAPSTEPIAAPILTEPEAGDRAGDTAR